MNLSREDLSKLLQLIDVTALDEIDCSELLHRLAAYIERLGPDERAPLGFEDVVQHLCVCPECFEEFEALHRVLRGED